MDGICFLLFFRFMNRFPLLGKAIAEGGEAPFQRRPLPMYVPAGPGCNTNFLIFQRISGALEKMNADIPSA